MREKISIRNNQKELLQKGLMRLTFQASFLVAQSLKTKNESHFKDDGIIYSLLNRTENKLTIGFTTEFEKIKLKSSENNEIVLGFAYGTRKEKIRLQQTLLELGYKSITNNESFSYSNRLMKHLRMLLWPTGDSGSGYLKIYKKRYKKLK